MPNPKKLVRQLLPTPAIRLAEKSYRTTRGVFWYARYGFAPKGMNVIAVTGTNGKTTTASFVNAMLQANGLKTAVYTTAYFEIDGQRTPNTTHMTVSSEAAVQKFFADARVAKVDWVIWEVTSHALHQHRGYGIKVDIAAITNLTPEHLDYHKTMENYAAAKALLFGKTYRPTWCILNADDKWYEFFKERSTGEIIAYGKSEDANLQLKTYDLSPNGTAVTARYGKEPVAFTSQLIGQFNAYNALAAYGIGLAAGLDKSDIAKGVASLDSVPGRMERVDAGQKFNVVVDYAHTTDALENVLTAVKEVTKGKVILVFGATGDRDKTKRVPMGEIAGRIADKIFLTDDETYTEDPQAIIDEVKKGIDQAKAGDKTTVVADRREAIRLALRAAKAQDTVILTGIGHQDYRNMGGIKQPWDEREVAREELSHL